MAGLQYSGGCAHGGREAAGYLMHDDPRVDARTRTRDAQIRSGKICHIDTSRSKLNYDLVSPGGYGEAFKRYKERRDLAMTKSKQCVYKKDVWDKKHTKILHYKGEGQVYAATRYRTDPETGEKKLLYKKGDPVMADSRTHSDRDRITMVTVVVYAPEGMTYEERRRWFTDVTKIFAKEYGAENLVAASVHEDEVHDYYDRRHECTRQSRVHMHLSFVPCDEHGALNGHWATARGRIMYLNGAVENMSVKDYGVHFMTGEKYKERLTVEELKALSITYEQQQRTMQAETAKAQAAARKIQAVELLGDTLDKAAAEKQRIDEETVEYRGKRDRAKAEAARAQAAADKAQQDEADALLFAHEAEERQRKAERKAAEADRLRIQRGSASDIFEAVLDGMIGQAKGTDAGRVLKWVKKYAGQYSRDQISSMYRDSLGGYTEEIEDEGDEIEKIE